ncbi:UDP-N-acetylmuramoyl-tripeptide--D-alanyl-D-alanine ligase [Desemzia sp. RIT804]|uniref:UDP-N-acetylmuramoyl-tripeptide--D-alanyl-D- alanine ligase n=1 Tax=Desemzia sp. RIT 804 TaxID=2810209 RepID=UPI001951E302|nr:UDP-N-acetylmuramoyl-tripeptide--D-alanyl-D-alanine ligase [Desemzia sp. RIT 804]MBM6616049.1 UDP-N-acetylmuramoyl-tripeptide--D-alanyl-D-alanine ligase [Desemzia sp. RIT 804]
MISLMVGEIAKALGSLNDTSKWDDVEITAVGFDTRKMVSGSLFVPLIGENDGHKFIQNAIDNGAKAALWSAPLEDAPADFPVILVEDTLLALQELAQYYLKKVAPKVVGITGSNGKTTTKDMTDAVMSSRYRVYKTQGNFNNQIGLPITILSMPVDTEVVILEMGMSDKGEIEVLSHIAEPDIAIITMIGESHIEFLGSRANIADAKMEITSGMKEQSLLIYPGEEELLEERAEFLKGIQLKTFGTKESNDIYPLQITNQMRETSFITNLAPSIEVKIPVLGTYNVNNALAALTAGMALDIPIAESFESLAQFQLTKNRTEWDEGINGSMILNDSYNANPTAMKLVIENFSQLESNGKKYVVLGDMLELGDLSEELHVSVKEALDPAKVDEVYLYGAEMKALQEALLNEGRFSQESIHYFIGDKQPLIEEIKQKLKENDYILIKSSFGTDLLSVVEALKLG